MGMPLALFSSKIRGRRRNKRQRRDDLVSPEIPFELQIEILTRLPPKSLMRFKCVSKLWSSLIRSRYFTNRVTLPTQPPRMYMSLVNHFECGSMEVCYSQYESLLLSLSPSSSKSLDKDSIFRGMGGHNMVLVRGLILYIVCRKACICNPATRQSLTLPAVKSDIFGQEEYNKSALYFLGYDHVLDQYKVVCSVVLNSEDFERIKSEHWVFVLEAGGSWKKIEFNQQAHVPTRSGLCINGVIHYLASTCMSRSIVVSFDVRSEEFSMIQVPHVVSAIEKVSGFIEYGGRPAILDHTNLRKRGKVDLWVLEDGGKWVKKSRVLRPSQMHLIDNNNPLVVQGTTRNGEVILSRYYLVPPFYILYYDLEKNDMRKVKIRGIPDHWFSMLDPKPYFYFSLLDNSESIIHLEA